MSDSSTGLRTRFLSCLFIVSLAVTAASCVLSYASDNAFQFDSKLLKSNKIRLVTHQVPYDRTTPLGIDRGRIYQVAKKICEFKISHQIATEFIGRINSSYKRKSEKVREIYTSFDFYNTDNVAFSIYFGRHYINDDLVYIEYKGGGHLFSKRVLDEISHIRGNEWVELGTCINR